MQPLSTQTNVLTILCLRQSCNYNLSLSLHSHQLQQQAVLVLQENQLLIDQLEAQHVKAKANHSRHHSEGTA